MSDTLYTNEPGVSLCAEYNCFQVLAEVTVSAQAAERVKAQVQKVKDKAQKIVDEIAVGNMLKSIFVCLFEWS